MSEEFEIREYSTFDLKGVLDLWEYSSGWGRPEESVFNSWLKTPFGKCVVVVAETEEKEIVGQIIYTPTLVYFKGKEFLSIKVSAPIIHHNFRTSVIPDSKSLIGNLFFKGNEIVKRKGFELFYVFPAHGWIRSLKSIHRMGFDPWEVEVFPCLEIVYEDEISDEINLIELNEFPDSVQEIWERFKYKFKDYSFVTRNLDWLKYKYRDQLILGVKDKVDNMIGYVVIKRSSGLILDFIIDDFSLTPILFRKLKIFHSKWIKNGLGQELKIMSNNFLKPYLNSIKTEQVEFKFVFGISFSLSEYNGKDIEFDKWYIFPND